MSIIHKTFIFMAVASAVILLADSCEEQRTDGTTITPFPTAVTAGQEGGEYFVTLSPSDIDDREVVAKCGSSWVGSFNIVEDTLFFNVARNEGDERSTSVSLNYSHSSSVTVSSFTVIQKGSDICSEPFSILIDTLTETSFKARIIPGDMDMTYAVMSIDRGYFDEMPDDNAIIENIMNQYSVMAQSYSMDLSSFLKEYILKQGESGIEISGLSVGTEYVLITFGLSQDGTQLTELVKTSITTRQIEDSGVTFEFDCKVDGTDIIVDIIPSDDNARYYYGILESSWLEDSGLDIKEALEDGISLSLAEGGTVESITSNGRTSHKWEVYSETEYIVYACTLTGSGFINSDIATVNITSGKPIPSDNILNMTISNIMADRADYKVTASNADPYVFVVRPSAEYAGMNDADILDALVRQPGSNYSTRTWDSDGTITELTPDTEYYAMAFGYESRGATTDLVKFVFKTLPRE